ncbi:unnamed protein product [Closterium sp. NIES-53]
MGALFSKRKAVTDVDKAILSLRTQKRKLAEYQKKVGAVIEREQEVVRQMIKEGKKDRALLALKKKKLQTDALAKSDAWVLRVEQQVSHLSAGKGVSGGEGEGGWRGSGREVVRQMVKEGKKDRALLALKKKKLQTDALAKLDAWVLRVEQQVRAELSLRSI